jgi:PPP family 3-phenylpropionic acid transporter
MSPAARLRLFYFAYYGSVGAYLPYFAAYLRGLGFSGEQIGTVQMMSPLVAVPAAIAWATAADRLGAPARALRVATAWSVAAFLLLPFARSPWVVGAVLLVHALGDRAVIPLVDSVAIEWARSAPGATYARIRLFGSLGYVAVAQGLGLLLMARGDRPADPLVPAAVVACVAAYALAARRLPAPSPPTTRPRLPEMLGLLRSRPLLLFLAACAVHWAATAPFHLLFGVRVRDLGLPAGVTGLGMAVGVGAEVLALLAYQRVEGRLSLRAILATSFAVSALRWLLLSRTSAVFPLVALQLLHAFTFGLFWGGAIQAMSRLVPSRLRATGQALLSAIVFGLGNAAGYQLSGLGYDRYGSVAPLFGWAAAVEVVALAVLLAIGRGLERPGPEEDRAGRGVAPG